MPLNLIPGLITKEELLWLLQTVNVQNIIGVRLEWITNDQTRGKIHDLTTKVFTRAVRAVDADQYGVCLVEWKELRVWLPLQMRLWFEQIFWDAGGRWRSLVTGFRPVSER